MANTSFRKTKRYQRDKYLASLLLIKFFPKKLPSNLKPTESQIEEFLIEFKELTAMNNKSKTSID